MEYLHLFMENFIIIFSSMAFYIMLGLLFVGILHIFVPQKAVLKLLGKDSFGSVVNAAAIGVPLPLCSCGVVPTAVELKKDGASNGAVISFLISTPQTGVDSILATYSIMGLFMAIYRAIAAFLSGLIGGAIVNIFAKNAMLPPPKAPKSCCCCAKKAAEKSCCSGETKPQKSPIYQVFSYAYGKFLDDIAIHFIVGVVLASLISTFLPPDLFVKLGIDRGILGMLAMVCIGLPMYICSVASIPIALSLMVKGVSMGGAFVFLFTGPVTNIASILILSRCLGRKITTIYLLIVVGCATIFGLLLDYLVTYFDVTLNTTLSSCTRCEELGVFSTVTAVIMALLLAQSVIVKIVKKCSNF